MVQKKVREGIHVEDDVILNNYAKLGRAIVMQAIRDYVSARERLKMFPGDEVALAVAKRTLAFFKSSWMSLLAPDLDGEALVEAINRKKGFRNEI